MSLQNTIREQIKDAMRARETVKLQTLRGLLSQFINELVSLKHTPQDELTNEEALNVVRRAVKQRKDSIEQFTKGGRPELADSEKTELNILETYLPAMMSKKDVMKIAIAKKDELNITDKSKMGMFIGALMKDLKGKADGDIVKAVVDELLS
jgi:hypothetical protein